MPFRRALALHALAVLGAALCIAPAAARAAAAPACPTHPARLIGRPSWEVPPGATPQTDELRALLDIGSDGRTRDLRVVQSSGDRAIDAAARDAIGRARFEPAETGCVAYSDAIPFAIGLRENAARATPPELRPTNDCTPFVNVFIAPVRRNRAVTGSAVVAVDLDAAGTETHAAQLRQSTGSATLDEEAVRIARTAQFSFVRSDCRATPFTYLLELTFR